MTALPAPRATVRVAASNAERDTAIDDWLRATPAGAAPVRRAILAEGALFDGTGPEGVPFIGLAAGCPCCVGLLPLRVKLGRTLRDLRPEAVLLLLATEDHLPRLRRLLEDGELGQRIEVER
jgi:hypothetical protein